MDKDFKYTPATTEYAVLTAKVDGLETLLKQSNEEKIADLETIRHLNDMLHYYNRQFSWRWFDYIYEGIRLLWSDFTKAMKFLFRRS